MEKCWMKYCYPQRFNRVSFLASGGIFPAVMDNGCCGLRILLLELTMASCSMSNPCVWEIRSPDWGVRGNASLAVTAAGVLIIRTKVEVAGLAEIAIRNWTTRRELDPRTPVLRIPCIYTYRDPFSCKSEFCALLPRVEFRRTCECKVKMS